MARPLRVSVVLPVPPNEAFAYVADPRHDPEWCKAVPYTRHREGTPLSPGAVYAFAEGWKRDRPSDEGTVTIETVDAPHRIAYRAKTRDRDYHIEYLFEPHPEGTRLTQVTTPRLRGAANAFVWLFRPMIRMQHRRQFRDLQTVLRGEVPAWRQATGDAAGER